MPHPLQKYCIFETPHAQSLAFILSHFRCAPNFRWNNAMLFLTLQKMTKIRPPPIQKGPKFDPLYKNGQYLTPLNKNGQNLTPHIQKMPKFYPLYNFFSPPHTKNGIFETPYTKSGIFKTPYTKNGIFETPYTKNCIFETPYTKNWHFRDTPIQKNYLLPPSSPFLNRIALSVLIIF